MEKPQVLTTHLCGAIILPKRVGSMVGAYNSKTFNQVEIKPEMTGHYLGEFSITCKPVKQGRASGPLAPPASSPSSSLLANKDFSRKKKKIHKVLSWHGRIYKEIPIPSLRSELSVGKRARPITTTSSHICSLTQDLMVSRTSISFPSKHRTHQAPSQQSHGHKPPWKDQLLPLPCLSASTLSVIWCQVPLSSAHAYNNSGPAPTDAHSQPGCSKALSSIPGSDHLGFTCPLRFI